MIVVETLQQTTIENQKAFRSQMHVAASGTKGLRFSVVPPVFAGHLAMAASASASGARSFRNNTCGALTCATRFALQCRGAVQANSSGETRRTGFWRRSQQIRRSLSKRALTLLPHHGCWPYFV